MFRASVRHLRYERGNLDLAQHLLSQLPSMIPLSAVVKESNIRSPNLFGLDYPSEASAARVMVQQLIVRFIHTGSLIDPRASISAITARRNRLREAAAAKASDQL
jgi:hypothetical protein